jgi:DNA-binding beta-propeller fold protein YncE
MKPCGCISVAMIALTTALLCLQGCESAGPLEHADSDGAAAPELQWPSAPDPARITYLAAVTVPRDAGIRQSWLNRIWRYIRGGHQSGITRPLGVHVDADGRLYVVDSYIQSVHVFVPENSKYYRFPGKPIEGFVNPVGITTDLQGRVYVSDSVAKVVHVFADHGETYAGALGATVLERPTGLAYRRSTNEILVVDTLASEIVAFDADDLTLRRRVGRNGTEADALHYPTSISASPDGRVFVTDALNFRIQILDENLRFVGSIGAVGDGPGYFSRPKGVGVDAEGHIYVVDALFDNVQIFDADGNLLLVFGSSGQQPGQFWLPSEIYIDSSDRIYVSDTHNSRVQIFQYHNENGSP